MNEIFNLKRKLKNNWLVMAIMMLFFLMTTPMLIQIAKGNDLLFCFFLTIYLLIDLIPVFRFRKFNKKLNELKIKECQKSDYCKAYECKDYENGNFKCLISNECNDFVKIN